MESESKRSTTTIVVCVVVVFVVILIIYYLFLRRERVVVFRADPVADALLKYHRQADPITLPRKERLGQDENIKLVRKLWR